MAFSVAQILEWTGGRLANGDSLSGAESKIQVSAPAPLPGSRAENVSFFFAKEFQHELPLAQPGVLVTGEPFVGPLQASGLPLWKKSAIVACRDPYLAMAILSERFADSMTTVAHLPGGIPALEQDIHPKAVVHPGAKLGPYVRIGANAVIEDGAEIGSYAVIYPGCYVGPGAAIGEASVLFANVTVYEKVSVGKRARIHSGTVLGADGFGYAPRFEGGKQVGHQKIYHMGRVVIGDDVEIGANSCVDRGTISDTVIGNQVKIDNLVQVGHNARVEEGAVICGDAALAGSSVVGRFAYVGGMAGVTNKIVIGEGSKVAAQTLVTKDVPAGATVAGNPQREYNEHFRAHAALNRLAKKKGSKA